VGARRRRGRGPLIGEDDIREVKARLDICELIGERVTLRRKGRVFWGLCPFHGEKTGSFKVDPTTGLYYCFGCGESGDAITFVMKTDGLDFNDAVRLLADRTHYELSESKSAAPRGTGRARVIELYSAAERFYANALAKSEKAKAARDYLAGRGFHSDTARRFGLGWAEGGASLVEALKASGATADELVQAGLAVRTDDGRAADRFRRRIMFPIADTAGRVIAFGGRVIDDSQPKYLNSADSNVFSKGKVLYALDRAKKKMSEDGAAVVVEGYTDVIAAHEAGLTNVVATLGTAFTEDHLRLLSRFADRVYLVFDADVAGQNAAERGLRYAGDLGSGLGGLVGPVVDGGKVDVQVAVLPEGKDPADVLADGREAFEQALAASEPLVEFVIERRLARHDLSALKGRLDAAHDALEVVATIESGPARSKYVELLRDRLHLEEHTIEAELKRVASSARTSPAQGAPTSPALSSDEQGLTPELLAERQALAAIIEEPELTGEYEGVLGEDLFSHAATRRLWQTVKSCPAGSDVREAVANISGEPGMAAALASVLLATSDAHPLVENFSEIVARLKEFSLRRQIEDMHTQLAGAERTGTPTEEISAQLWELQRELHAWRQKMSQMQPGRGGQA
jgi:DNA primase